MVHTIVFPCCAAVSTCCIIIWQKQHDGLDFCTLRPPIQAAPNQFIEFRFVCNTTYYRWLVCDQCEPHSASPWQRNLAAVPGVSRSQILLVKHALLLVCALLTVTRKACKTCKGYEMFHSTFPYGCQYFPSQLLYSRNRYVHQKYPVAMAVIRFAPVSSTCSHWPRLPDGVQPPLLCGRVWAASPLLAVRAASFVSAELHPAKKW